MLKTVRILTLQCFDLFTTLRVLVPPGLFRSSSAQTTRHAREQRKPTDTIQQNLVYLALLLISSKLCLHVCLSQSACLPSCLSICLSLSLALSARLSLSICLVPLVLCVCVWGLGASYTVYRIKTCYLSILCCSSRVLVVVSLVISGGQVYRPRKLLSAGDFQIKA